MTALRPDVRAAVRRHLERLARMLLAGDLTAQRIMQLLAKLVPGLPFRQRRKRFGALVAAVKSEESAGRHQLEVALDRLMVGVTV